MTPHVVLVLVEVSCHEHDTDQVQLAAEQWAQEVRFRAVDGCSVGNAGALVVSGTLGSFAATLRLASENVR